MSCIICAEDFNKSKRLKVICQYCSFEACRSCCERYLLDKQVSCCMNTNKKPDGTFECGNVWTRQFMVKNFTKNLLIKNGKKYVKKIYLIEKKHYYLQLQHILNSKNK